MNKITKFWILSLTLLAFATIMFWINNNALADQKVTITLTNANNSCTPPQDYAFPTQVVWDSAINLTWITHPITCSFLQNAAVNVTIQLATLSAGNSLTIPNSNFYFAVAQATASWNVGNLAATGNDLSSVRTIFKKPQNKLWSWKTNLTISGTVPAFTAAWTYTGALELMVQAGS